MSTSKNPPEMLTDLFGAQTQAKGDGQVETPPRQSCSLCKRRKLRCDRQLPCSSCTRLNFECIYEGAKSQQTLRRHRAQKPQGPSGSFGQVGIMRGVGGTDFGTGPTRSFGASEASSPESRPRPVAKKTLNQSATSTGWSVDQLTSEDMTELEQIFFRTIHQSIPMLHQYRYNTATISEPRLRPPNYLRYAICALGAFVSPSPTSIHNALYRASRKCLEETELNDTSAESMPLTRPQAWILISVYELLQMQFQRWRMSTARAVRLTQLMGLHSVDRTRPSKRLLAIAKDWTELEEQRRTFWQAFCLDRHTAFGHGCPMIIDERDIHTLLPVSEDAFESCIETESISLYNALNAKNIATLPPSAAAIVLTAETGHRLKMLQQDDFQASERQTQDEFWKKVNWLDDTLHYAFQVPPHLAASGFNHTPYLTYLHMCAPSSTILLHQTAEEQASAQGITPSSLLQSQALRLAAAEMVASTMRLAEHADIRLLHPFTGVALVTAAKVFMRALAVRTDDAHLRSLHVLLDALSQLQILNPLTGGYFKDLDTEFPGMRKVLHAQSQGAIFRPKSETPSTGSSYTPPLLHANHVFPFPVSAGYVSDSPVDVLSTGSGFSNGDLDIPSTYHSVHDIHDSGDEGGNLYFSDRDFFGP